MEQVPEKRWGKFGWIVAASVAVHLIVAALLFARLPDQKTPEKEEAVNVDLVPPPEEKKPEEKAPQKATEPPPEKKAEKPPEPPPPPPPAPTPEKQEGQQAPPPQPPQEKAEEKKAEPPPPPPKPEEKPPEPPKPPQAPKPPEKPPEPPKEVKAEEQPKPPEPPQPQKEEAKAEESPKPEEKQPDTPPPPKQEDAQTQAQSSSPTPMKEVIHQFGSKDNDGGPRQSLDGNAPEDSSDTGGGTPDTATEADTAEPPASADEPAKPDEQAQSANPVAKDINLPEVTADDTHPENDGPKSEGDGSLKTSFATEKKPEDSKPSKELPKPGTKTTASANGQTGSGPKLTKVKTLFSRKETSDLDTTMTAMAGIPREQRFGTLCYSELFAQLSHSLGYRPGRLPSYLGSGTTLTVSRGAFEDPHAGWRYMSFKCEVDSDATKVVSFSFGTGDRVPQSEWNSLRIPKN
jgi:hypothetical protein